MAEKKIIISGDAKTIGFIIQENRIRAERGDIKFIDFEGVEKKQPDLAETIDMVKSQAKKKRGIK